jgi:hypothetical protein
LGALQIRRDTSDSNRRPLVYPYLVGQRTGVSQCKDLMPKPHAPTAVAVGIFLKGRGVVVGGCRLMTTSSALEVNCQKVARNWILATFIRTVIAIAESPMTARQPR